MKDAQINIVNTLISDTALATLMGVSVPNKNIFAGPVDIVKQLRSELGFPLINLKVVSESYRSVPTNAKDSRVQLDIWGRSSELQVENIYERIASLLNYDSGNQGSTHIFWQRVSGLSESYETDMRLWHWSADFVIWNL